MKVITCSGERLFVDEQNNRMYVVGRRFSIVELKTLHVSERLSGYRYLCEVVPIHKYDLLFLVTNNEEFWLLNINDYSVVKRFKCHAINSNVYYDDKEDKIYTVGSYNLKSLLAVIDVKTLQIKEYSFPHESEDRQMTWYSLHKCVGGELYLFKSTYNIRPTISDCVTTYGKYRIDNGTLKRFETIYTGNESMTSVNMGHDYPCNYSKYMYRVKENDVINYEEVIKRPYSSTFETERYIYFWQWFKKELIRVTKDFKTVETVYTCGAGERIACYTESEKYKFLALEKCEESDKNGYPIPNKVKSRILVFDKNEPITINN